MRVMLEEEGAHEAAAPSCAHRAAAAAVDRRWQAGAAFLAIAAVAVTYAMWPTDEAFKRVERIPETFVERPPLTEAVESLGAACVCARGGPDHDLTIALAEAERERTSEDAKADMNDARDPAVGGCWTRDWVDAPAFERVDRLPSVSAVDFARRFACTSQPAVGTCLDVAAAVAAVGDAGAGSEDAAEPRDKVGLLSPRDPTFAVLMAVAGALEDEEMFAADSLFAEMLREAEGEGERGADGGGEGGSGGEGHEHTGAGLRGSDTVQGGDADARRPLTFGDLMDIYGLGDVEIAETPGVARLRAELDSRDGIRFNLNVERVVQLQGAISGALAPFWRCPSLGQVAHAVGDGYSDLWISSRHSGLPAHVDGNGYGDSLGTYVLHLAGDKEWRMRPTNRDPYKTQVLSAGDLAYVPRGWAHETVCKSAICITAVIGVQ